MVESAPTRRRSTGLWITGIASVAGLAALTYVVLNRDAESLGSLNLRELAGLDPITPDTTAPASVAPEVVPPVAGQTGAKVGEVWVEGRSTATTADDSFWMRKGNGWVLVREESGGYQEVLKNGQSIVKPALCADAVQAPPCAEPAAPVEKAPPAEPPPKPKPVAVVPAQPVPEPTPAPAPIVEDKSVVVEDKPVEEPPVEKCEPKTVSRRIYEGGGLVDENGNPLRGDDKYLSIQNGEDVAVVTVTDMDPDGLMDDKDNDGDILDTEKENPRSPFDKDEMLPGLSRDRIESDVQALRDAGFKGNFVVYEVTDCNGRTVVACWDIKKGEWGFVYPRDADGLPIKNDNGNYIVIDTKEELSAYLNQPEPIKKP